MKKPLYKRWYVWLIGFILFAFIISPFLPETDEPEAIPAITEAYEDTYESASEDDAPQSFYEIEYEPEYEPTTEEPEYAPSPEPTEEHIVVPVMVWLSETGTRWHIRNNCGTMNPNAARQVTLEYARSLSNFAPCGRCNPPN